jgi:hypothetical protein
MYHLLHCGILLSLYIGTNQKMMGENPKAFGFGVFSEWENRIARF